MKPERIILTLSVTPKTPTARAALRHWVETDVFPHDDICDLIASMLSDDARDAGFLRADFTVRSVSAAPPTATTPPAPELLAALRLLMAAAIDALHTLSQAAANPANDAESRRIYADNVLALQDALNVASAATAAVENVTTCNEC